MSVMHIHSVQQDCSTVNDYEKALLSSPHNGAATHMNLQQL